MSDLPRIDFTSTPLPGGPWTRGNATVAVEEHPLDAGFSMYILEGAGPGRAAVMLEAVDALPSALSAALVLWRAVANASRICPCCGARAAVAAGGEVPAAVGRMEHEHICCLSDDAIGESWEAIRSSGPLPEGLPAGPRVWEVRPPRLALNQKPKKGRRR